ncbi:MAG: hypothetical protein EHM21_13030 [Chloroflexi bacterium]|nr:MAG: hypothetical protein EHM21_13030 [Chloroflexota bacterium]
MKRILLLLIVVGLLLAGCSGSQSGAVGAVNGYYQAILAQNSDQLKNVTCPGFLETAQTELDSFQGVKTEMQGFSCQETGKEGENSLVKCAGKIVATYGSEKMDFPLADRVHTVQNQGGSWQVCGY